MVSSPEGGTQKRKASPSPSPELGESKRIKIEEEEDDDDEHGKPARVKQEPVSPERKEQETPEEAIPPQDGDRDRDRTSDGAAAAAAAAPPPAADVAPKPARRDFREEEKKRGKRMFGGLLNTLSKAAPDPRSKKRLDIERRQQEKAKQQWAEDDRYKVERMARQHHSRQIDQVKYDEQAMEARHSRMLATARCLQTRSLPRLSYEPWKLTREQERIVDKQVRAARVTIDREREEFRIRKERRLWNLGGAPSSGRPPSRANNTLLGEPKPPDDANDHRRMSSSSSVPARVHAETRDHDENGDEVLVHDEEDTVLY
ncbi:pinin/SDK/memA/ protein conserved region-domain-containing protein [Echria macrotheca]|uniref:Pinin/SDK/memA/ protein conserved region-domain-containing protein n=1 Tax=Echria macrotheca TaxID=438768 RepID=A0AAJ0B308_9PEZI|nr:pinin/SDK/memA/ protein conserved region-domain-containing protein [Echria macrotheca]